MRVQISTLYWVGFLTCTMAEIPIRLSGKTRPEFKRLNLQQFSF
ncbi:hypothetical protein F889_00251 [Acinetobacter colistiniresistens]|uniref:Uncharacterized protein n=1 Tax=Acinetobacter colistiniresistens TaxID=280145 RepID=N9R2L4_9GAMM|nr:hypothetical protein F889_00251 [Acinetobacter colistiniresistens]